MAPKRLLLFLLLLAACFGAPAAAFANHVLIPMDETQKESLKAYGIAYWLLGKQVEVDWLLNYRGGSFAFEVVSGAENELAVRGVTYQVISEAQYGAILAEIADPNANMDVMKLEKVPKIAVYTPKGKQPWDDAVTMVLTYAEIPYTQIYDDEVLRGDLPKYDWLHLHHEDFTGEYGKFYASYRNRPWYQQQQRDAEAAAKRNGFTKVSQMKGAVTVKMQEFIAGGGFMFAMCSATDSYDIALAGLGVDMVESMYDGDPSDPQAQQKLNFNRTLAFKDFLLVRDPYQYEYSNIDMQPYERGVYEENDYFQLFTFSAKYDPVPTMLTQNHEKTIKGFMGQTTAFRKSLIKPDVVIMGDNKASGEVRYMHGTLGKGTWTFYGGHDPEDYQHLVEEEPTDLSLHPNSPGYRLILNNILFPAAKKKKQKT
ncbi:MULTISPECIES: asparagine synthetase B [Hymenobacter]|uniref:Asparagine synthetase B n=1 Tax=Hymenobacter jejuensis TaxID=2502781 RepID=A0A5B8A5C3_9BACT|nr:MULTISPECIES: asparagine synthetase B [Hymenobacter]MBC6989801.1 asparagine synthetase B [Hymenobacter sp. BT491]QDA61853.1 asparagine synthetase B [Hymenobacter jejuensis]